MKLFRIAVLLSLSLLATGARADPLNARPGAWEMTVTAITKGDFVPPEALARVPPEKRAALEKMIADHAGKRTVSTVKTCVRKDDLEQDRFLSSKDPNCTLKTTTRTPTRLVATRTCTGPPPSEGRIAFEAKNPESVAGTIDQSRADGGTIHVDLVGKWLATSCEGIDKGLKKLP